jgi:hypothetical protein
MRAEIEYEVLRKIKKLGFRKDGWQKELRIISWNGADPKYDIRSWKEFDEAFGKGVTLTGDEARDLFEGLYWFCS